MNAPLPSVQPAAQSTAPQASSATPDAAETPFSQVLSGEMAQRQGSRSNAAKAADAPRTTRPEQAKATDDVRADSAKAEAADAAQATLPDAMLALAQHPELLKTAPDAVPAAPTDTPAVDTAATTPAELPLQFAVPGGATGTLPTDTPDATAQPAAAVFREGHTPISRSAIQAQPAFRDSGAEANTGSVAADKLTPPASATALLRATETAPAGEPVPNFMTALVAAQSPQVASVAAAPLQAGERLAPTVGTPAWNQALGDRIVWMATGNQQAATLTLNPPDLGPLQVVVNVSNEQATASFYAAQPEVRQALEAALPRLRDMMQDAGIQLGQATVSADTPRQQDMQQRTQQGAAPFMDKETAAVAEQTGVLPQPVRTGRGLVDTFA